MQTLETEQPKMKPKQTAPAGKRPGPISVVLGIAAVIALVWGGWLSNGPLDIRARGS